MQVKRRSTGQLIHIDESLKIGGGGEGTVYQVPNDRSLAAKIYRQAEEKNHRSRKLKVMLDHVPLDPTRAKGHVSIAWPVDILDSTDGSDATVGYLMPSIEGALPISNYYDVTIRHLKRPLFTYAYLCRIATNLASAVRSLHQYGYVIGDVNESNILVTETAMVTLIDTDSFQVTDPRDGCVYRCPVGTGAFTPRELQNGNFQQVDRSFDQDMFGIAVLFFQLLMEGTRPFAGIFSGSGDPPDYETSIQQGFFPYGKNARSKPPKTAPPFDILPAKLRELFVVCFERGHRNPKMRPDAEEWFRALQEAEESLTSCSQNEQHLYFGHRKTCPWCERAASFQSAVLPGWDPFPSRARAAYFAQYGAASAQQQSAYHSQRPADVFQATPASVIVGGSVNLQWNISNARSVTIRSGARTIIKSGNAVGTLTLFPVRNTVYSISADASGVNVPPEVRVMVSLPPTPCLLNQASLPLKRYLPARELLISLAPVILLKHRLARLYSNLEMASYAGLNGYIKLASISVTLMTYSPHAAAIGAGHSPSHRSRSLRTITRNLRSLLRKR